MIKDNGLIVQEKWSNNGKKGKEFKEKREIHSSDSNERNYTGIKKHKNN